MIHKILQTLFIITLLLQSSCFWDKKSVKKDNRLSTIEENPGQQSQKEETSLNTEKIQDIRVDLPTTWTLEKKSDFMLSFKRKDVINLQNESSYFSIGVIPFKEKKQWQDIYSLIIFYTSMFQAYTTGTAQLTFKPHYLLLDLINNKDLDVRQGFRQRAQIYFLNNKILVVQYWTSLLSGGLVDIKNLMKNILDPKQHDPFDPLKIIRDYNALKTHPNYYNEFNGKYPLKSLFPKFQYDPQNITQHKLCKFEVNPMHAHLSKIIGWDDTYTHNPNIAFFNFDNVFKVTTYYDWYISNNSKPNWLFQERCFSVEIDAQSNEPILQLNSPPHELNISPLTSFSFKNNEDKELGVFVIADYIYGKYFNSTNSEFELKDAQPKFLVVNDKGNIELNLTPLTNFNGPVAATVNLATIQNSKTQWFLSLKENFLQRHIFACSKSSYSKDHQSLSFEFFECGSDKEVPSGQYTVSFLSLLHSDEPLKPINAITRQEWDKSPYALFHKPILPEQDNTLNLTVP
jgi:hypothetical protein